jgi:hypothetical protein
MQAMKSEILKAFTETRKLWILACSFDGINPSENFVEWSIGNPFTRQYNRAMKRFLDLKDRQKECFLKK